jgi:hypothetical protein
MLVQKYGGILATYFVPLLWNYDCVSHAFPSGMPISRQKTALHCRHSKKPSPWNSPQPVTGNQTTAPATCHILSLDPTIGSFCYRHSAPKTDIDCRTYAAPVWPSIESRIRCNGPAGSQRLSVGSRGAWSLRCYYRKCRTGGGRPGGA